MIQCPLIFEDDIKTNFNYNRGSLVEIHTSDLHFDAINPAVEYDILKNQFLSKIKGIKYDILSIDGDLFDRRVMANSDSAMYASLFFNDCVSDCRAKGATFVIIMGTKSHDDDQLKLFYSYLTDRTVDVRIVETARFEYIKGAKVLCLPEEYGKGYEYYSNLLFNSGFYDTAFMHGTVVGSVFGANKENLSSSKAPVFSINSFDACYGPIMAGHVHTPGCFGGYIYYCGTPIRYKFGEEEEKGFFILLHNLDTHQHLTHFETIQSFKYNTIELDTISMNDPNTIVEYLNTLQVNGIDHLRLICKGLSPENLAIIKNFYKGNSNIKIEVGDTKKVQTNTTQEVLDKYKGMGFLLDPALNEYEKFVRFINYNKGSDYITVEKLKSVLNGDI